MAKATKFTSSYLRAALISSPLCNNPPVLITISSSRPVFICLLSFFFFSLQQQEHHLTLHTSHRTLHTSPLTPHTSHFTHHLTSSQLREQGRVVPVPGHRLFRSDAQVLSAPCDDRFILELACRSAAVVVSNDSFNDLVSGKPEWQVVAENRLIR
jgi:hypothetical protein